jgi:choline dehydrogenase-like flavoprotein
LLAKNKYLRVQLYFTGAGRCSGGAILTSKDLARDGFAVDWPIRYKDLAPWYSHVENFIGVSGNKDGLEELPDGEFLPPMELTAAEEHCHSGLELEA